MPVTIILSDEQAAQLTEFLGGVRVFTINPQHAKAVYRIHRELVRSKAGDVLNLEKSK